MSVDSWGVWGGDAEDKMMERVDKAPPILFFQLLQVQPWELLVLGSLLPSWRQAALPLRAA